MKKKIFAILIILILIIVGIFAVKSKKQSKYNYEIEAVNEYNYYIYKDNEQYGVIDKNGGIIVEAKYSNVVIPNPEKDIFVCYNNQDTEVLNSKKEKLFTNYEMVEAIKLKNVASALTYEKSVLMYKQEGLYGLIDFEGKVITKNSYHSIENLQPTEGKFLVSKDDKYGIIDIKGNTLVDLEYNKVTSDGYYTEKDGYKKSGFIVSNKTEDGFKYGYISYTGKKVLDAQYNEIERISKEDDKNIYLICSENGQFGLYQNSKKIIQNEYQSITYDDNVDLIILQKNKKYGAATLEGKIIIHTENDELISKGIYLYAKNSNDKKVYDMQGNTVDINYNRSIYKTENEEYRISTILNNNITYYGITDKNNNQLVDENYRYIEYLYKNYFIATDEKGNLGVINSSGKVILDMKYSSLQKIKGKNIVQAVEAETGMTEYYSAEMKKVATVSKANTQIQNDYIIVSNDKEKIYLDDDGNLIKDASSLKNTEFPDKIGDYKKEQITIENVYYIKE